MTVHLIDEARTARFEKPWTRGHTALIALCGRVSRGGGMTHDPAATTCCTCIRLAPPIDYTAQSHAALERLIVKGES